MNRFIVSIFLIIMLLFTFTNSAFCTNKYINDEYSYYINSLFYCMYRNKYEVKLGNYIPVSKKNLLFYYLKEYINQLEKDNYLKKINILIYYEDGKFGTFISDKQEQNINPKYV